MKTSLQTIAEAARRDTSKRFYALYSYFNRHLLKEAYYSINKNAAPGIDGVTYKEYGKNLDENLIVLETKLKEKRYWPKMVQQVLIPKTQKTKRAIAIAALEDRLVQWVGSQMLTALFEPLFIENSHSYRKHHSGPKTAEKMRDDLMQILYRTVVEADISSFFDTIDHEKLIKMVEKRVNDKSVIRLIRRWLNAGIRLEDGTTQFPEKGCPQGGNISPILANIYLHYALDQWFETIVRKRCKGNAYYTRYADDFLAAFEKEWEAGKFLKMLSKRLEAFGLKVAEKKTGIVTFNKFDLDKSKPISFLGYTFFWGKSLKGKLVTKMRTSAKKLHQKIQNYAQWIKKERHKKLWWILDRTKAKIMGHMQYYGTYGNGKCIRKYVRAIMKLLYKWLNRRSQRKSYNHEKFENMIQNHKIWDIAKIGVDAYQLSFLSALD